MFYFFIYLKNEKLFFNEFWLFLVPELYRKLREACRNNFSQVSSKSALVTPSYLQKTTRACISLIFCIRVRLGEGGRGWWWGGKKLIKDIENIYIPCDPFMKQV